MLKKNKFKKIAVSLVLLLFLAFIGFSFVSAQLTPEVKYPKIGTKEITEATSLGEYISYIFSLGIIIGVLIAIGVLIYGGFLFLSSTGKPEQLKEAQDRIFSAFLGLIILLGSYLILATVNPQLTIIKTELVSINVGLVLIDTKGTTNTDDDILKLTEISVSNVQKIFGKKFEPKKIEIAEKSQGRLKARAFPKPDYQGTPTDWITNEGTADWTIKSLEVRGIGPGIYLLGDQGKELHLVTDHGDFRKVDDFNDKAKKIEIKNLIVGDEKKTDFAAILHTKEYFKDGFRIFIEKRNADRSGKGDIGNVTWDKPSSTSTNEATLDITPGDEFGEVDGVTSAHIFQIGDKGNCKRVILYKNPEFVDDPDDDNDVCELKFDETSSDSDLPIYKPKKVWEACGTEKDEWNDKTISIEIDGKCLVALFEHDNARGSHSEVFTADDPDLTDNPIGKCRAKAGWFFWATEPCTSAIAVYPLP